MSRRMFGRSFAVLTFAAALACARPAVVAPRPQDGVTVVPMQVVNNHVHVHMRSGTRELSLIYDTGAGISVLDIPVAESLGYKLGGKVNVGGAGANPVRAFALSGGKLALPQDTTIKVSPVVALEMSLAAYEGIPVNGILGADFTRQSVVQIDYPGERLLLHPLSWRYAGSATRIPITFKEGKPHAVGQILLADGTRIPADCHIDVGASSPLALTAPFVKRNRLLERAGPTIRRRAGRGVGGSSWATIGRVAGIQLGTTTIPAPITAMYGDSAGVMSSDTFDCNVGGEILRRFNVYFDYGRKEMILEPTAAVSDPFEADMSGAAFRLDPASGGVRISDIMPRGPAEIAGLREEDLIVSIDGRPALGYGLEALRRRLRRPEGEVVFTVRRAQGDQEIRLPVRRLI